MKRSLSNPGLNQKDMTIGDLHQDRHLKGMIIEGLHKDSDQEGRIVEDMNQDPHQEEQKGRMTEEVVVYQDFLKKDNKSLEDLTTIAMTVGIAGEDPDH